MIAGTRHRFGPYLVRYVEAEDTHLLLVPTDLSETDAVVYADERLQALDYIGNVHDQLVHRSPMNADESRAMFIDPREWTVYVGLLWQDLDPADCLDPTTHPDNPSDLLDSDDDFSAWMVNVNDLIETPLLRAQRLGWDYDRRN